MSSLLFNGIVSYGIFYNLPNEETRKAKEQKRNKKGVTKFKEYPSTFNFDLGKLKRGGGDIMKFISKD